MDVTFLIFIAVIRDDALVLFPRGPHNAVPFGLAMVEYDFQDDLFPIGNSIIGLPGTNSGK